MGAKAVGDSIKVWSSSRDPLKVYHLNKRG